MFSKSIRQLYQQSSMNIRQLYQQSSMNISFAAPKNQHKKPVRVAVTGAAGNIGYSTLFRIADGAMLGRDQPVILHLIDLPPFQNKLIGTEMELWDCAFPLLQGVVCTDNLSVGFKDVDYALLIGAKPRSKGMERSDLLKDNGKIFIDQGKAINDNSSRNVKVLVVGNPANTNCMIAAHYAKDIPKQNFHAMTRLDHDRALSQLSQKLKVHVDDIKNFCIWGNHSPTMFPDITYATANGKPIAGQVDKQWLETYFYPTVQQRGAAIIKAREASSAASAGNAAIQHMRDWATGTNGQWNSFSVSSQGEYGIEKGLIFSYPVIAEGNGKFNIVQGLKITPEQQKRIDVTRNELLEERKAVEHLLQ